jgi:hypothetical protein
MVVGPPLIHRMMRLFCRRRMVWALARRLVRKSRPGAATAAPAIACLRK